MDIKIDAPVLVWEHGGSKTRPSEMIIRTEPEGGLIQIVSDVNTTIIIDKEQARLIAQFLLTISK